VEEEPENMCFGGVWTNERLMKLVHHFLNWIRIGWQGPQWVQDVVSSWIWVKKIAGIYHKFKIQWNQVHKGW